MFALTLSHLRVTLLTYLILTTLSINTYALPKSNPSSTSLVTSDSTKTDLIVYSDPQSSSSALQPRSLTERTLFQPLSLELAAQFMQGLAEVVANLRQEITFTATVVASLVVIVNFAVVIPLLITAYKGLADY